MTDLQAEVIRRADGYVGKIVEKSKNDHPKLREWWPLCGVTKPSPWCAIAVCGVVHEAGMEIGTLPKLRRSASVHRLRALNEDKLLSDSRTVELLTAGIPCVLLHDSGGGLGHAAIGFAYDPKTKRVKSYDGNSDVKGDRDGDGYFMLERPLSYWNLGAFEVA